MENFYDKYEFFNLTILDSPIEEIRNEIHDIIKNWWGEIKIYESKVDLDRINPPPIITPGGTHFVKILIWEPTDNNKLTAVFVNLADAYDSLIYVWNKRFKKQSITVRLSNDATSEYPHHEFKLRTKDNIERVVYSHVETKWEFYESGPIQAFENIEYYKQRKIRDRLNNEIINEYMAKLGFNIWSKDFYSSERNGIFFEQLSRKK